MLVRGIDSDGLKFEDAAHSYDVSRSGASFLSNRELEMGMTVEIIIPRQGSSRGPESDFVTQAKVVRVERGKSSREIRFGVVFVGPRFHRVFLSESTF